MLTLSRKEDCVGCGACVQRCPKGCLALREDAEGFLYPEADASRCIDCGLCEKVCPVIHPGESRQPLMAYAAVNGDEAVRRSSSSGGVFTALALETIERGGVVFGAKFDGRWEVVHGWTDRAEGLAAFRGAKYAQSCIGNSYKDVESFLRQGREVLFSGTPCQVAGLRRFLRREYAGLLTVDVVCHGVPSPGVWRDYLRESREAHFPHVAPLPLTALTFRDKSTGWKQYSFTYMAQSSDGLSKVTERASRNAFMRGFLADLYLRPSCYACPAKRLSSGSDLTVGDYWGVGAVHPALDDDGGVSVVSDALCGRAAFQPSGGALGAGTGGTCAVLGASQRAGRHRRGGRAGEGPAAVASRGGPGDAGDKSCTCSDRAATLCKKNH